MKQSTPFPLLKDSKGIPYVKVSCLLDLAFGNGDEVVNSTQRALLESQLLAMDFPTWSPAVIGSRMRIAEKNDGDGEIIEVINQNSVRGGFTLNDLVFDLPRLDRFLASVLPEPWKSLHDRLFHGHAKTSLNQLLSDLAADFSPEELLCQRLRALCPLLIRFHPPAATFGSSLSHGDSVLHAVVLDVLNSRERNPLVPFNFTVIYPVTSDAFDGTLGPPQWSFNATSTPATKYLEPLCHTTSRAFQDFAFLSNVSGKVLLPRGLVSDHLDHWISDWVVHRSSSSSSSISSSSVESLTLNQVLQLDLTRDHPTLLPPSCFPLDILRQHAKTYLGETIPSFPSSDSCVAWHLTALIGPSSSLPVSAKRPRMKHPASNTYRTSSRKRLRGADCAPDDLIVLPSDTETSPSLFSNRPSSLSSSSSSSGSSSSSSSSFNRHSTTTSTTSSSTTSSLNLSNSTNPSSSIPIIHLTSPTSSHCEKSNINICRPSAAVAAKKLSTSTSPPSFAELIPRYADIRDKIKSGQASSLEFDAAVAQVFSSMIDKAASERMLAFFGAVPSSIHRLIKERHLTHLRQRGWRVTLLPNQEMYTTLHRVLQRPYDLFAVRRLELHQLEIIPLPKNQGSVPKCYLSPLFARLELSDVHLPHFNRLPHSCHFALEAHVMNSLNTVLLHTAGLVGVSIRVVDIVNCTADEEDRQTDQDHLPSVSLSNSSALSHSDFPPSLKQLRDRRNLLCTNPQMTMMLRHLISRFVAESKVPAAAPLSSLPPAATMTLRDISDALPHMSVAIFVAQLKNFLLDRGLRIREDDSPLPLLSRPLGHLRIECIGSKMISQSAQFYQMTGVSCEDQDGSDIIPSPEDPRDFLC